jgi:hypothetical protein
MGLCWLHRLLKEPEQLSFNVEALTGGEALELHATSAFAVAIRS